VYIFIFVPLRHIRSSLTDGDGMHGHPHCSRLDTIACEVWQFAFVQYLCFNIHPASLQYGYKPHYAAITDSFCSKLQEPALLAPNPYSGRVDFKVARPTFELRLCLLVIQHTVPLWINFSVLIFWLIAILPSPSLNSPCISPNCSTCLPYSSPVIWNATPLDVTYVH